MPVRSVISKHKNLKPEWILSTLENVDFTSRTCYIFLWNKCELLSVIHGTDFLGFVCFFSRIIRSEVKRSTLWFSAWKLFRFFKGHNSKTNREPSSINLSVFFIVCGPTSDTPNFKFVNGFLSLAKDLLLFNITWKLLLSLRKLIKVQFTL